MKKNNEKWFPINFQWIPVVKLNNELNIKTNKMKNLLILPMIFLLISISSCSDDTIIGSGDITSEFRNVANFSKVSSEGIFVVNIIQGSSQSVEIIADNNILSKVKSKVVNDELRLYLDNNTFNNISLEANITVTRLNSLKNSGAGNMYVRNIDEPGEFRINNSGSADILIQGSATSFNIKNEGSGSIEGFDFFVNDCNVEIDGSGNVKVSCTDNLKVDIDGSGSVYYIGNPTIDADISGSGQVINDN